MDSGAIAFFTGFTICIGIVVVLIELIVMCFASLFSRKERNMFTEQIKAGADLLEEKIGPVWLERQNLERLCLADPCNCVVAQACPDKGYIEALMDLFGVESEDWDEDLFNKSDNCGFATGDVREYPTLTDEWKAYIQDRRTKQLSTIEQVP
jgi:hypothetical protein